MRPLYTRLNNSGSIAAAVMALSMGAGFLVGCIAWPCSFRPVALWVAMVLPLTVYWVYTVRAIREGFQRAECRMAVEAITREAVWVVRGNTLVRETEQPTTSDRAPRLWLWWLICAPIAAFLSWFFSLAGTAGAVVLALGFVALAWARSARLVERGYDIPAVLLLQRKRP